MRLKKKEVFYEIKNADEVRVALKAGAAKSGMTGAELAKTCGMKTRNFENLISFSAKCMSEERLATLKVVLSLLAPGAEIVTGGPLKTPIGRGHPGTSGKPATPAPAVTSAPVVAAHATITVATTRALSTREMLERVETVQALHRASVLDDETALTAIRRVVGQ